MPWCRALPSTRTASPTSTGGCTPSRGPGGSGRSSTAPVYSVDRRMSGWQSDRMDLRIQCFDIDTSDPGRLADFWQSALGWRRTYEGADEVVLEPPAGSPDDGVVPDLLFLRVPE